MKYIWIIGGSIHQMPAILEAKKLGLGIVCSDYNNNCIAKKTVDIFVNISIYDKHAHINKIRDLKKANIIVSGIVCIAVDAAITMGAVNDYFGFCGISEKIASICKDKTLFRKKMQEWDIKNATFQIITLENLTQVNLNTLNLPVIVKPNNGFGSVGTKIFHTAIGIIEHLEYLFHELNYEKLLIEEFFIGEEQTVEAIFDKNGIFAPEFITDRFFIRDTYPIEIGLQHPSQLPLNTQNELFEIAKQVGLNLGIKSGTIKLDTIVTKNGPRIIEATVRVAGGLDPYILVPTSTGKNIMQNAILTALNEPLKKDALVNTINQIGLSGSPFPKAGKIAKIEGIEIAKSIQGVKEILLFAKVGDTIKEYKDGTSRVCFVIVTHNDIKKAKLILKQAIDLIKIETE